MRLIKWIWSFFSDFAHGTFYDPIETHPLDLEMNKPSVIKPLPKYIWSTPPDARHSVRLIADEEGLDVEQKNTMCATIGGESGWHIDAINQNTKDGKVTSVDYGICQWNNYYHGKEISPTDALNDPEKAVRLMCAYWKRGERDTWIAYKNGRYLKFM